ncbi:hypothetical protein [Niabella hibiscisoli]|nr:hypothetical protein [Niabella hibiscisoli]
MYSGNLTKWRKLVNSFQLHVLINLSKKTGKQDWISYPVSRRL